MNVTFCIKTHERPEHLGRLLESIRYHYPQVRTLIADDSREPKDIEGVEVVKLPYDSGLSAGRNALIDLVETDYYVQLDDDFVFTKETRIEKFLDLITRYGYDILGGVVMHYGKPLDCYGSFKQTGKTIEYCKVAVIDGEVVKCQIVPMFFIANKKARYDEKLVHTEHFDFFYSNRGLKVGYTPEVKINHVPENNPDGYDAKRRRNRKEYLNYILDKHGLDKLVSFTETVTR